MRSGNNQLKVFFQVQFTYVVYLYGYRAQHSICHYHGGLSDGRGQYLNETRQDLLSFPCDNAGI